MADKSAYKVVDFKRAKDNLDSLKSSGGLSARNHRRLSKGIANIQNGQAKGYGYDFNRSTNSFSAKDAEGNDARGKSGGVSGLNFLQGRKTSKAMGYLANHLKDSEVPVVSNQKNGRFTSDFSSPSYGNSIGKKENEGFMKFREGGTTGIQLNKNSYGINTKVGQMKAYNPNPNTSTPKFETPSWMGQNQGKPLKTLNDRARTNFNYSPKVPGLKTPDINKGLPDQDRDPKEINTMGLINKGLGAVGAISTLTARQPTLGRTPAYKAKIRPFSGNQRQLDETIQSIGESSYKANDDIKNAAGSNLTGYLTGRAFIESNKNQAVAAAYSADSQIMLEDRNRYDQAMENENQFNHAQTVSDQKEREARELQNYQSRTQTGQAMMQNSLGYMNAEQAHIKNNEAELKMVQEKIKNVQNGARYTVLASAVAQGGVESLTPEMRQLYFELFGRTDPAVPKVENGGKISYLKKGGKFEASNAVVSSAKDLRIIKTQYSKFVSDASRDQIKSFGDYIKQINRINRVKITRN